MIKPKQQIHKQKNPTTRKPSLPLKRNSSVHSNASDQSCMSDRIVYKKNASVIEQPSIRQLESNQQSKKCFSNTLQQSKNDILIVSDKSLKKIKSKLNISGSEGVKKNQIQLTGFQWLIIMRHCFHIENKRRSANSIKQRTLVNYIRNKMYPDSLWNKILVVENQRKLSSNEVIATIQKQTKWKLTLDDILVCIGKNFVISEQPTEEPESAAETARFTQNMKPNLQKHGPQPNQTNHQQNYYSQPKFIYKNPEKQKSRPIELQYKKEKQKDKQKTKYDGIQREKEKQKVKQQIQPMSITSINSFQLDQGQLGLNISPISVIDQTNDISFSLQDSQQPSQIHSQTNSESQSQTNFRKFNGQESMDRFEQGFNGIQAFKQNLQFGSNNYEDKILLVNFLEQILSYSIYKNKQGRASIKIDKKRPSLRKSSSPCQNLDGTQYMYGLKLQSRCNLQKFSRQILQRLFTSPQFSEYFNSLNAIKITQYYNELSFPLQLLGPSLQILNLSNNNIRSISALKAINGNNMRSLKFINLNFNQLKNIGELLSFQDLDEIHVKSNLIDHVHASKDRVCAKKIKIIDLSYNQINKEEDLWALNYLPNLAMLNLAGNSILTMGFKPLGVIPKQVITDHCQMYVFSAYIQYKDIAFSASRSKDTNKQRESNMSSTSPNLSTSNTGYLKGSNGVENSNQNDRRESRQSQNQNELRFQYHSQSQSQLQGAHRW